MNVRKLYYEDSHLQSFEAVVTGCEPEGNGWSVTLSATAFYPEGGGQACDTGKLGDANVLAVREAGEEIFHFCDKPLEPDTTVTGVIDWEHRFDLMQQHSGEHMVSGVIHQKYGYHNVGFHMGADLVTIDFDGLIAPEDLQDIEDTVNAVIWKNLPMRCWYPTAEELLNVPYRRKKDLPWPVRIVEIPGIDLCACCGTQVKRTGEVGLVKLFSCVKFHEGVRIEMACGKRALTLLNTAYEQNKLVSQAFSAKIDQTGQAAKRMNETLGAEKFRATGLEKQLFGYIAKDHAGENLAVHFSGGLSSNANRELCDAMAEHCKIAVALSGSDETGYSICIISRTENIKQLGADAFQALRGRGGGKPNAVQGSITAPRQEIERYFTTL